MIPRAAIAFLFDVDDTLLDHDRVEADLGAHLDAVFGAGAGRAWHAAFEAQRAERGCADFIATVQRVWADSAYDPRWLGVGDWMLDYPFAERVYPGAREALATARRLGTTAIVSDGDAVMQPRKIRRAGLWAAVDDVLVYQHKQDERTDISRRCPAAHHVMVDDKPKLLAAMKDAWGDALTTVLVRQGHYAHAADAGDARPAPDHAIQHIGQFAALAARLAAPFSIPPQGGRHEFDPEAA